MIEADRAMRATRSKWSSPQSWAAWAMAARAAVSWGGNQYGSSGKEGTCNAREPSDHVAPRGGAELLVHARPISWKSAASRAANRSRQASYSDRALGVHFTSVSIPAR